MSKEKANERINSQISPVKNKNSTTKFVVMIAGVIILVLGIVVLFQIFRNRQDEASNKVVTMENVEEIVAQFEEKDYTPVGSFEVSMPTVWNFQDGLSASEDAFVDNVVNNRNTIYFTVVLESAPSDVIYQSPYIEVGGRLEDIKLDMILEAGTYEAIMTYYLVDENMRDVSEVSVGITLVVAN